MKKLICENPNCGSLFFRYPRDVLKHNYCSRSCAASVNNRIFPKRRAIFHPCELCGKGINKSQKFCSLLCKIKAQKKHSRVELLNLIKNTGSKLGRTPARRELGIVSYACIREFGSWNKAVVLARFKPHRSDSQRMYKRMKVRARDGHECDSISEAIIDNWFFDKKIEHQRNYKYPSTNHKADWVVNDNIFIEYFGLVKDSRRYDRSMEEKKKSAQQYSIRLIELYPSDLYPKIRLAEKLSFY